MRPAALPSPLQDACTACPLLGTRISSTGEGPGTWDSNGRGSYVQTILLLDPMGLAMGPQFLLVAPRAGSGRTPQFRPFNYDEGWRPRARY